ncbi:hypothetical protein MGG_16936 [Pyricularia oryzae 70-15]|uniref:Uncharacterized protein n=1 Tax=Pyricularia oryzae (strain 70-15 / ATCC MYA-4617 / FGSC 8958) TaxID=242507 RepID=G4N1G6_PYRO7|nr:uncharacterized protein MGG_16936 [Pyricularia oryzae 70-15]EHA53233.1 hypothetical protein MGG_16936 [Pyricularia oryzae 70-15]
MSFRVKDRENGVEGDKCHIKVSFEDSVVDQIIRTPFLKRSSTSNDNPTQTHDFSSLSRLREPVFTITNTPNKAVKRALKLNPQPELEHESGGETTSRLQQQSSQLSSCDGAVEVWLLVADPTLSKLYQTLRARCHDRQEVRLSSNNYKTQLAPAYGTPPSQPAWAAGGTQNRARRLHQQKARLPLSHILQHVHRAAEARTARLIKNNTACSGSRQYRQWKQKSLAGPKITFAAAAKAVRTITSW